MTLFITTRLVAAGVATALLIAHEVTSHDGWLVVLAIGYGGGSVLAASHWPRARRLTVIWVADAAITLALVLVSEQWRSPFYLLALTSLILPATALPWRRALAFGGVFTVSYFAIAVATGIDWHTLETTARLESLATHLMVPMLVVLALAYSERLLRRLDEERNRSELLALEGERRRIALELHDSAKQRIHAANLVLSASARSRHDGTAHALEHAARELRAASAELDTNLTELRTPLGAGGLELALRERAAELEVVAGEVRIDVTGQIPELPAFLAAHAFHIVSEAMTNAARHAKAKEIRVRLSHVDGGFRVVVSDDGLGMPRPMSRSGHGIRSMVERAEILGGTLTISGSIDSTHGTTVELVVPLSQTKENP